MDRIARDIEDALRHAQRAYRITWAPGVTEIIEAFDLHEAYTLAYDLLKNGRRARARDAALAVTIDELETGRAWRFDRRAFAGYQRHSLEALETLGLVTEMRRA